MAIDYMDTDDPDLCGGDVYDEDGFCECVCGWCDDNFFDGNFCPSCGRHLHDEQGG